MTHGDLTDALMIFELVTFAKVKLHPLSFISRSAIHRAMTHLIFVPMVEKLRGAMWLRGANQLYYGYSIMKKNNSTTPYLTCDDFRNMTTNIEIILGFQWQKTHVEFANDVVHLQNIEY